jgi:hypothetical protein
MDPHQRIAGAIFGAFGLVAAVVGATLLWKFFVLGLGSPPIRPTGSAPLLLILMSLAGASMVFWAIAALTGGVLALMASPALPRVLVPVALPAVLLVPVGTLLGAYALWSVWRHEPQAGLPAWKRMAMSRR